MTPEQQEFVKELSVEEVAQVLLDRAKAIEEMMTGGFLPHTLWKLRVLLGIIPTVDMTAYRQNKNGEAELFAIVRQTGPFAGLWCPVGGIVPKGSTIEEAMRAHWKKDLGFDLVDYVDWNRPLRMNQHMPPDSNGFLKEGVLPEPTKHSIAPFYIVQVTEPDKEPVYGTTAHGGQEAGGFRWFTESELPPRHEFAYGFYDSYKEAFAWLKNKM